MATEPMTIVSPHKKYNSDGQFIFSCQYHVLFCPKYRRKVLINGIDVRLKVLIEEKQEEYGYQVINSEVMPDHVHLLLSVNPKIGIYSIVTKIKGYTSFVLRQEFPELVKKLPTLWTRSRFISSVGAVSLDVVKRYIEEQKSV
jgi:putative transposase